MLRSALGPAIAGFLEDDGVVEVMLNPDGRLWIDRLSGGLDDTGHRVTAADAERILRLVAHHVGVEVHAGAPRVSAELPETGERFEGLLPPVVAAPCFAIRRPAVAVFTLGDYVDAGIMSAQQAALLRAGVLARKNILVAGGTSTGKTTLVNALLAEIANTGDRVVLIEDTRELQCTAPNLVALRTKDGAASLSDLVRSSLRLRPDRIPIGEVRGAEALDLLKAWGTGHPGGVGTLHAGSAIGALRRLEQLIQEAVVTVPRALIAETIDLIAVLAGRGSARRLVELAKVKGLGPTGDYILVQEENRNAAPPSASCGRCGLRHHPDHPCGRARLCRRLQHALGAAAQSDPRIGAGPGRQSDFCDHHRHHRPYARVRRNQRRLPSANPDRLRHFYRLRRIKLLPQLLSVRGRSARVMEHEGHIASYYAPVHRALTEPILLGGAPRAVAIVNGTLAAAVGLGLRLWIVGGLIWLVGHLAAVWATKQDAAFVDVVRRHLRYPPHLVA